VDKPSHDTQAKHAMDQAHEDALDATMSQLYAEIDANANIFASDADGQQRTYIGIEYGNPLYLIERFVERALNGERAFSSDVTARGCMKHLTLAKYFSHLNGFLARYSSTKVYSPHVELFFDVFVLKHGLVSGDFGKNPDHLFPAYMQREGEFFDQLIQEISRKGSQRAFKRKVYARTEVIEKGLASAKKYLNDLYERYSRLLVLRIDFGFRTETPTAPHPVTLQEAQEHLARFMNNRRGKTLYANMVGYIWRLEYGREKGYHYHLFFFFDGAKVCRDDYIGNKIGSDWIKITDGKGIFYNCNAHKRKYKRLGIGMISHDDLEMRTTLLAVLRYMYKEDQTLREKYVEKTHGWGRGITPRGTKSAAGRPRRANQLNKSSEKKMPLHD
jgi:hypothetical protein